MNYLLDTCVLSEFTRKKPAERLIRWMDQIAEDQLYLSVVTVGEIQRGIARLPASHRQAELSAWLQNDLLERFGERLLSLDAGSMVLWGALVARLEAAGKPISVMDGLIAATALQHNLVLATRNRSDYGAIGLQLTNPWE